MIGYQKVLGLSLMAEPGILVPVMLVRLQQPQPSMEACDNW